MSIEQIVRYKLCPEIVRSTCIDVRNRRSSIVERAPLLLKGMTITFLRAFGFGLWLTAPFLLVLAAIITILGQVVGRRERWSPSDSFYWSFITATTVGYGDIRPTRTGTKITAVLIALLGFVFTGILIAVAVEAATLALRSHDALVNFGHR